MRDRDMIDVDVTSPGVWDREADMELDAEDGTGGGSSEGSSGGGGDTPREKERRSRGQALTVASLKLWTSMVCLHFSSCSILWLTRTPEHLYDSGNHRIRQQLHIDGELSNLSWPHNPISSNSNDTHENKLLSKWKNINDAFAQDPAHTLPLVLRSRRQRVETEAQPCYQMDW